MEQGLRPKRAECLVFYKCIRLACSIANQSLGLKTRKDYRNGGLNVRAGGNGSRTRGRINFPENRSSPFLVRAEMRLMRPLPRNSIPKLAAQSMVHIIGDSANAIRILKSTSDATRKLLMAMSWSDQPNGTISTTHRYDSANLRHRAPRGRSPIYRAGCARVRSQRTAIAPSHELSESRL